MIENLFTDVSLIIYFFHNGLIKMKHILIVIVVLQLEQAGSSSYGQ